MADRHRQRIRSVRPGQIDPRQQQLHHVLNLHLVGVADPDHRLLDRVWGVFRHRDTLLRDLERSRNLHEQGLVSDEDFEAVRRESEDAIQAAALAELELSRTLIRAPFAGVIVQRYLDVGAMVADGAKRAAARRILDSSTFTSAEEVAKREVGEELHRSSLACFFLGARRDTHALDLDQEEVDTQNERRDGRQDGDVPAVKARQRAA